MKYTTTNQSGETRPAPVRLAANVITTNAIPAKNNPKANFAELEGCRSPMRCQMKAKTGANIITKIAGTDWNQLEGNCQPKIWFRVSRSANNVILEPACSYVIQNMIEKSTRIKITSTRISSSPFKSLVEPPR